MEKGLSFTIAIYDGQEVVSMHREEKEAISSFKRMKCETKMMISRRAVIAQVFQDLEAWKVISEVTEKAKKAGLL